jgi:hypothetical protein
MCLHPIRQPRHFRARYTRTFSCVTDTASKVSDKPAAYTRIDDGAAAQDPDPFQESSACAVRVGAAYSVQHPTFGVY